jgi:hypothetical protein
MKNSKKEKFPIHFCLVYYIMIRVYKEAFKARATSLRARRVAEVASALKAHIYQNPFTQEKILKF